LYNVIPSKKCKNVWMPIRISVQGTDVKFSTYFCCFPNQLIEKWNVLHDIHTHYKYIHTNLYVCLFICLYIYIYICSNKQVGGTVTAKSNYYFVNSLADAIKITVFATY
jgi:hypothetical protein